MFSLAAHDPLLHFQWRVGAGEAVRLQFALQRLPQHIVTLAVQEIDHQPQPQQDRQADLQIDRQERKTGAGY